MNLPIWKTEPTCSVVGGIVNISWRPRILNLPPNGSVEQAQFCFHTYYYDNGPAHCFPACGATFFANGTLKETRSYQKDIISFCHTWGASCKMLPPTITLNQITWSPETQTISCSLLRTCLVYQQYFSVVGIASSKFDICQAGMLGLTKPAKPFDVHATEVKSEEITISWKLPRCGVEYYQTEVYVLVNGDERNPASDYVTTEHGVINEYSFTITNLLPYKTVAVRILTERLSYSSESPIYSFTTKQSAPGSPPVLKNVDGVHGDLIQLTWEIRDPSTLNGVANITRIIGMKDGKIVYNDVRYGNNRTSTLLAVNSTQRCAYFKVKICNAPNLCSGFSQSLKAKECFEQTTNVGIVSSSSQAKTITILAICVVLFVIFCAIAVYCCYRRKKKEARPKLPDLEPKKDCAEDLKDVRELSQLEPYSELMPVKDPKDQSYNC
ncbi:uncharacterized protein LOC124452925 isoform X2 [Xenia sp. Carnegie-2017]|uniref:uncharacterized protein LOC124452925 isoform X2 n=1 Tax=Xenia sp. Carnegie-2017 TaxID=2897299 RepID=UPI001F04D433|nr:uncharacterized protein LOC124452925 isoform X2 [Xenia sp. Carnegie-2017]